MTEILEIKAALAVDDAGEITGIAWPFGTADRVGDVIEKGAFANAPASVPMLFCHDQMQVIGVWDQIAETPEGLTVKGRLLVEDVARAREARAMIRAGAVTGLSIGFATTAAQPRRGGRSITSLDLHEISVVAVPAHPGARIATIKSTPHKEHTTMENEDQTIPATAPANAPAIDTKAFDDMRRRLDQIEAKAARPQVALGDTAPVMPSTEAKAFGSFLRRGVERLGTDEVKALTISNDANGGYLAPAEFGTELLKLLVEFSPIRQYARVIQISAPEITYPRRVTGTAATWTAESDDRTASGMTFEQVTLTPHELATFTDVSNALLEDNVYSLEAELLADYAESFAKTEGLAFVKGTGTGQPKGIMAAANGIQEIKTGAASTFPVANPADVLIAMYHKLATTYAQAGAWMMNRQTLGTIRQWKDGNGRYLVLDPITAGGASTLLGRPIVEMPDMDGIVANGYPVIFGDFGGYRIVDRVGLSTLRDPYTLAVKGQVRFHARKRVGADLTHPDRFVKLKIAA